MAHWRAKFHLAEACFRDHYGAIHTRNAVPPMSRLKKRIKKSDTLDHGFVLRGFGQKKKGQAVALPWPLDHVDEKPEIHTTHFRNAAKVSAFD